MKNIRTILAALAALFLLPFSAGAQDWLELPASASGKSTGNTVILKQDMQASDGGRIRSHTYCYDKTLRISRWVAYPLNKGLIGDGNRGDGWHPSSLLPEKDQAVLWKGFKYGSGYDRGHQIPSADRLDMEINNETFVYINATPQRHYFNGGVWADLEKLVRTWAKRSDTLFVVTGVIPGKETISDNDGNPVCIPEAYYKVVLREDTDYRGRIYWSMAAVLIPHDAASYQSCIWEKKLEYLRGFATSVDAIQKLTGEVFFPNLEKYIDRDDLESLRKEDSKKALWWWL